MRSVNAMLVILALHLATPAGAEPLLAPEDLKDHLWEHADLDGLAASLPPRRLVTRRYRHEDTKIRGGLAIGLIKAPITKVLPVAADFAGYKDMLPFFKESTVLGSGGNRTLVHVKIGIAKGMVTLWGNLEFFTRKARRDVRVVEGRMIKGNMKVFETRFEMVRIKDDRTLILVRLIVDPDLKIAKRSKATEYNQVNARRFIRAIRDRAVGD